MSKLYSLYKNLKKQNNDTIYLFQSGIFYIALSDDAVLLSNKFNFKLTNLNNSVLKCGFPTSSIDKYTKIFNNNNVNFKLVDIEKNIIYLPNEYTFNKDIVLLLNFISSVKTDNLSISEAYEFIEHVKKQAEKIKRNCSDAI